MRQRGARRAGRARRGQALVEFALVVGLFLLIIGAIVQFGLILWSQNAVTNVARDTARWAVTQSSSPCDMGANRVLVAGTADTLAQRASLIGHSAGSWGTAPSIDSMSGDGVGVDWTVPDGYLPKDCPPSDNGISVFVTVRVSHPVPIFIPGVALLGGINATIVDPTCADSFCVTSTTELRMEPKHP
jgi:hypothetical protein